MQRSNTYILVFTVILTVICAGLLAGVAVALKPEHDKQIELDIKSQILGAVTNPAEIADIREYFSKRIKGVVVNSKGEEVSGVLAENVNPAVEFKKKNPADKLLPVFMYMSEDGSTVEAYILPMYGSGLWDAVWGFISLDKDLNTVKGATFDHKGETPGLGARIVNNAVKTGGSDNFQDRFTGRTISDNGNLVGLKILKGEKNIISAEDKHSVDGLSGASMTTGGVNAMMETYFQLYWPYLAKLKSSATPKEEVKEEVVVPSDSLEVKSDSLVIDSSKVGA